MEGAFPSLEPDEERGGAQELVEDDEGVGGVLWVRARRTDVVVGGVHGCAVRGERRKYSHRDGSGGRWGREVRSGMVLELCGEGEVFDREG